MTGKEVDTRTGEVMGHQFAHQRGLGLETQPQYWASREFVDSEGDDPRAVSARAEVAHRQSPAGRLEAIAGAPREMTPGETYKV